MAQFWRSSKFEVPLHTSKESLVCDLRRTMNAVILGEKLEILNCAEK